LDFTRAIFTFPDFPAGDDLLGLGDVDPQTVLGPLAAAQELLYFVHESIVYLVVRYFRPYRVLEVAPEGEAVEALEVLDPRLHVPPGRLQVAEVAELQPEHPAPHVLDLLIDLAVLVPHVVEDGVGLPRPGQVGGLELPVVLLGQARLDPPGAIRNGLRMLLVQLRIATRVCRFHAQQ
jgi:hypothetical protein